MLKLAENANMSHWQERVDMAAAFRWTARLNMHEAVANHFSLAVNEDGTRFLMNANQQHFSRIKASDLLLLDANDPATMEAPNAPDPTAWGLHGSIHRLCPHARCVMHVHSIHATVLACQHKSIPAFHYMVAAAGGTEIPCVPYALFGTEELAGYVSEGLRHHDACLMANHGQIAIGDTLASALELASEVENLATQFVQVLSLGKPKILGDAEMQDVLARFKNYGQKAQGD